MKKICTEMTYANLRPVTSGEGEKWIREGDARSLNVSVSFYFCEDKDLKQISSLEFYALLDH